MARVKVVDSGQPYQEGYVIEFRCADGKKLYKLSLEDAGGSWENWYSEEALERY